MKTLRMLSIMAVVVSGWITSFAQEAEVPGDHFSLEGALELFKESSSPEEFEKMLNSPDSKVNNLDLNGDGYIDYIRVHDRYERNIHAFIIQAVISEDQLQDIAVIELEKLANGKAVLQIIGDEDIYGVTTIIEPTREVKTYAGTQTTRTVVNVWAWPSVQYVYGPYYTSWVSPWGWHHHPVWYARWRPVAYVHYYPIWRPYYHYYAVCHTRRIVHAHDIYRPYRRTSVIVHHRHHDRVERYRESYSNGRTRDDGRQYARDDRSGSRNDLQRGRDNSSRTRDNSNRTRSGVERDTDTYQNRPGTRERSTTTERRGEVNQVRTEEQLRRAVPDQQAVRKERVTSYSSDSKRDVSSGTRSRTDDTPEPQRTRTSQPNLRTETTVSPNESRSSMNQRPATVQRNPQIERRTEAERRPQVQQQQQQRPQVERSPQVQRAPREVQQPSRPATVERQAPPSRSAPQRPAERPERSRGRQ